MTQTTRRTAKITTSAYTVVSLDVAGAKMIRCTANKDMTIQGVNGASVELKAGEVFYAYKAESLNEQQGRSDLYYIVRNISGMKKCSCPARKPCKHEIALAAKTAEQKREEAASTKTAPSTTQVVVTPS